MSAQKQKRFDSALMDRERNRQLLADALEANYSAERRKTRNLRLAIVGVALALVVAGLRSGIFSGNTPDIAAIAQTQKKLSDRKKIMEEIEKQMESGDQLMIGGESKTENGRQARRSSGDADDYGNEKVPLNLVGEVRQKKRRQPTSSGGANSLEYGAKGANRGSGRDHELESLAGRKQKRGPFDYGKYRPATPAESTKNPLPARSQRQITNPDLYVRLTAPSPRLAADTGAFPDLPKK